GQPEPPRALDLQEEEVDRVGRPGELEPAAGEGALLDLAAAREGNESAALDLAGDPLALEVRTEEAEIDRDELGRTAIDRHRAGGRGRPASGELRLVVAGEEAFRLAVVGDRDGRQRRLEE